MPPMAALACRDVGVRLGQPTPMDAARVRPGFPPVALSTLGSGKLHLMGVLVIGVLADSCVTASASYLGVARAGQDSPVYIRGPRPLAEPGLGQSRIPVAPEALSIAQARGMLFRHRPRGQRR
jgi:hypothetical protein